MMALGFAVLRIPPSLIYVFEFTFLPALFVFLSL